MQPRRIDKTHRRNAMKAHITLGSTLSNTSWMVRGAAALLVAAALIFTITLTLRPSAQAPAAAPAVQQAAPAARNPYIPVIGMGSAYDGRAYGNALPAARNSHVPAIGTGSAYDGGAYSVT